MNIKETVREKYGEIARAGKGCGCGGGRADDQAQKLGYAGRQLESVLDGANLGLGCGNPTAIAGLQPGETVLDLGSGAGFDAFLAANAVGPEGHVIGVDMTPEMIDKARANAVAGGYSIVDFRLGEIESLPVDDASVDVIISNCVINLVPDKGRAFAEAFRVLKSGGRLHVSDIVLGRELPASIRDDVGAYVGCVAGAIRKDEYLQAMRDAGFAEISIDHERDAAELLSRACCVPQEVSEKASVWRGTTAHEPEADACCAAGLGSAAGLVLSVTVTARRPK